MNFHSELRLVLRQVLDDVRDLKSHPLVGRLADVLHGDAGPEDLERIATELDVEFSYTEMSPPLARLEELLSRHV